MLLRVTAKDARYDDLMNDDSLIKDGLLPPNGGTQDPKIAKQAMGVSKLLLTLFLGGT